MRHTFLYTGLLVGLFYLSACSGTAKMPNTLSKSEEKAGWQLLFDGKTMQGWHTYGIAGTRGWAVQNGEMVALGQAGHEGTANDIVTEQEFENFDLVLEWKISKGGNSGIFFNVVEDKRYKAVYETGPEYQLIDDVGFPQKLEDWQTSAANYAMHPPVVKAFKPVGEWNHTRIVVNRGHVTHWLNGQKTVEYQMWTPEWERMVTEGKWKNFPGYGRAKKGKIALQDHGNQIWFKNIKIKSL
ncbi:MAG: DUF1080 domain-containing protein [Bacteroidetes Order II. Incertae sedis bacterium]|nr:DUF1080 domain-containing protein [Bacteroidetes Order II. bacterium]